MPADDDAAGLDPRPARPDEALAAADLWLESRRASRAYIPLPAHTDDEVRAWFRDVVFPTREVWVVGAPGRLAGLMVLDGDWLDQLYVHPDFCGRGIGSGLVSLAQQSHKSLDLWTFQANVGARRFYERHGFLAVGMTDGDNEEKAPDVRYHWEAAPPVATGTQQV